ncbi:hypothetical protein YC2023_074671 [Brassica napus]
MRAIPLQVNRPDPVSWLPVQSSDRQCAAEKWMVYLSCTICSSWTNHRLCPGSTNV